jgi:FMN phosphatase YigB (HAD superfamily)
MKVTENDNIVTFDVDDTLVMWDIIPELMHKAIKFNNFGYETMLIPHEPHIKLLKQFKARGQYVIVWSQGGYQWAREVVKTLGLEDWVDEVKTKPKWIVDDLPAAAWTKRSYLDAVTGKRVKCNDVVEVDFNDNDDRPEEY